MNINLHNYETWFLMYTDNELSAAERSEVEQFVQQHPELKDTFQEFQGLVISPEPAVYEPVTDLIKLNNKPVESLLLSYLDGELQQSDVSAVQQLIQEDAAVAEEWALLKQTQLQPETIIFEEKTALYKKPARVVSFYFYRRLAAAALLTGIGIFTGIQISQRAQEHEQTPAILAKTGQPSEAGEPSAASSLTTLTTSPELTTTPVGQQMNTYVSEVAIQMENTAKENSTQKFTSPKQKSQGASKYLQTEKFAEEKIMVTPGNKIETPNVSYAASNHQKVEIIEEETVEQAPAIYVQQQVMPTVRERKNPYAFTLENETPANESDMRIEEEKTARTKAGGFFKKVKRVIERKTNLENKESLLIGSFEIAIR